MVGGVPGDAPQRQGKLALYFLTLQSILRAATRLRHVQLSRRVRSPNVDIVTAATFLGSGRLDTTARYSRPSDEDKESAVEEIS